MRAHAHTRTHARARAHARAGAHRHESLGWFEIATGILLGAATLFYVGRELWGRYGPQPKAPADGLVLTVEDMTCQNCARISGFSESFS